MLERLFGGCDCGFGGIWIVVLFFLFLENVDLNVLRC